MPLADTLRVLFNRDLGRLITEIESYKKEENIWRVDHQIANSGGNLALHLVGNLQTYIGGVIGNSGYVRQREMEFSQKDVPRSELIQMIEKTQKIVDQTLRQMNPSLWDKEYPVLVFKEPQTYQHFLVHLATHLGYHLGQVNYHRRLLDI